MNTITQGALIEMLSNKQQQEIVVPNEIKNVDELDEFGKRELIADVLNEKYISITSLCDKYAIIYDNIIQKDIDDKKIHSKEIEGEICVYEKDFLAYFIQKEKPQIYVKPEKEKAPEEISIAEALRRHPELNRHNLLNIISSKSGVKHRHDRRNKLYIDSESLDKYLIRQKSLPKWMRISDDESKVFISKKRLAEIMQIPTGFTFELE